VGIEGDEALSRGCLILRGAIAVGALYGFGAVTPYARRALAAEGGDDVHTLNYLLLFEHLLASIYNRGKSEINDKGEKMPLKSKEKELIDLLLTHEGEHVAAVKAMVEKLGGEPAKKGNYAFAFLDYATLLGLANVIERVTIGAYNGAIPLLKSAEARELAFSIVQVEGRHAAAVLIGDKEEPAPEAFDEGALENTALVHIEQFTGTFPE
jgi:rubrerythrin